VSCRQAKVEGRQIRREELSFGGSRASLHQHTVRRGEMLWTRTDSRLNPYQTKRRRQEWVGTGDGTRNTTRYLSRSNTLHYISALLWQLHTLQCIGGRVDSSKLVLRLRTTQTQTKGSLQQQGEGMPPPTVNVTTCSEWLPNVNPVQALILHAQYKTALDRVPPLRWRHVDKFIRNFKYIIYTQYSPFIEAST
jgi:hypothetical protein